MGQRDLSECGAGMVLWCSVKQLFKYLGCLLTPSCMNNNLRWKKLSSSAVFHSFLPLCHHPAGKMIICNVTGIAHRRPQGESYDQAIRNDETGLWQCPFCQQDNFPELSEVGLLLLTGLPLSGACYQQEHCVGFLGGKVSEPRLCPQCPRIPT